MSQCEQFIPFSLSYKNKSISLLASRISFEQDGVSPLASHMVSLEVKVNKEKAKEFRRFISKCVEPPDFGISSIPGMMPQEMILEAGGQKAMVVFSGNIEIDCVAHGEGIICFSLREIYDPAGQFKHTLFKSLRKSIEDLERGNQ